MFLHVDLTLRRPSLPSLRLALDADLGPGRVHPLAGPPGAGQGELLRILAGRLRPDRGLLTAGGLIWFKGDASGRIEAAGRPVGAVFPEDEAPTWATPRLLVARALAHWPTQARPARLSEFMDRAGLTAVQRRSVAELGWEQRWLLGLACALAPRPDLLVMETPASGLPAGFAQELRAWIRRENIPALLYTAGGLPLYPPGMLTVRMTALQEAPCPAPRTNVA
jgi:molybdate transport system ATP-binding protein